MLGNASVEVGSKDVIYWGFTRINCLQELVVYYELDGFIIKVDAIIGKYNNNNTLDVTIIQNSIIPN